VCKNTITHKGKAVAKQSKGELVVVGFNYDLLDTKIADKVRSTADRIREKVKKTLEDLIEVGKDLQEIKGTLPHGQFTPWLKAEFGWGERMAQNFMSVAERFGPKTEIIADLTIQPTAACLLAAPSVPDEAREKGSRSRPLSPRKSSPMHGRRNARGGRRRCRRTSWADGWPRC
jgi:hypothetical protein